MAKTSKEYWRERVEVEMKQKAEADLDIKREYEQLHEHYSRQIENEINSFYVKYGNALKVDEVEMRKLADEMDVVAFAEKAKKYVEEKNFSPEANRELKIYNMKMRVNRLELLQYNIELEMVALANDEFKMTEKYLNDEYVSEMQRQAGILGEIVPEPATLRGMGQAIINTPFKGAVWSDSLWDRQNLLRGIVSDMTREGLIKGKHATTVVGELRNEFGVGEYEARRLAITEMARIQTAVQKDAYERNGFEEFDLIEEPTACDICKEVAKNGPYKTKDMRPGTNAAPIHPFCHCATAPHADRNELDRMFEEYEASKNDIIDDRSEFEKTFEDFDHDRGRREMSNDVLKRLDVKPDKVSIRKLKARGHNTLKLNDDGTVGIKEFALQSDDDRSIEYQKKTLFHEAYHAKMAGQMIDQTGSYGRTKWLDIEETFAETSSHYAVKVLGIDKKLSPAYPQILVDTLPRLKQLDKYSNASTLADFGKIAWEDRLNGTPSQWSELANELDSIDHNWQTYGLQYEAYIKNNKDMLFQNLVENSPQYNQSHIIELMHNDLDSAFEKANSNQSLNQNEIYVYSGMLSTAFNQVGVW